MYLSAPSHRMVTITASCPLAASSSATCKAAAVAAAAETPTSTPRLRPMILRHVVGALGRHLDIPVGEVGVVDLRHDRCRHVLQPFQSIERRVRLHGDALDLRVQLLQSARRSHKGSGGAQGRDKVRHLTLGLLPDFVAGCAVVRAPVFVVRILVGVVVPVRFRRNHLPRLANRAVGSIRRVGPYNLRAISLEISLSRLGDVRRHTQRHGKAHRRAQHRIRNACIAAGCIEKSAATAEQSAALRVGHDRRRCAIFYRSSRIRPLRLAQDLNSRQMGSQSLKPHQRSVADTFEDAGSERFDSGDHVASVSFRVASPPLRLMDNSECATVNQV